MKTVVSVVSVLTVFMTILCFEVWAQETTAAVPVAVPAAASAPAAAPAAAPVAPPAVAPSSGGPCNRTCPAAHDPVCGTDAVTYCNECTLNNTNCQRAPDRQVRVDYRGTCRSQGRPRTRG